ncbi:MAG: DUF1553 domain-containing protein [Verrucomicrobiales bacterium]
MPFFIRLACVAGLLVLAAWKELPVRAADGAALIPAQVEFFENKVRSILVERCYECHSSGAAKLKGGLLLDTPEGLLKGGDTGPAIVPGDPEKSRLIEAVRYKNADLQMPPKSPLKPGEVRDLEQWVRMGAPDPRPARPDLISKARVIDIEEGRKFWAFQPIASPAPPAVKSPSWIQSPIDSFILAALEAKGLQPAAPADKRTLLRRATFDLTGLPPAPEEVEAFLADSSPRAFASVVDRLLSSPRYGERWGRHWLDVARYADSNGLDENVAFGNAWRYRDYIVNAFNRDKPYDQMILEQLAGDLLPPAANLAVQNERLTALGFLSLGPKLLAEPDKVKLEMDLIDEQIDVLGRAFMGVTLGCARCHDHKFDPIPTTDYYGLVAIFKSTRTMDDLKTVARWHESEIANPEDHKLLELHASRLNESKSAITNLLAAANRQLLADLKTNALPNNAETLYPTNALAELKSLRELVAKLEAEKPAIPTAMGVTDSTNILKTFPVLIRGNHLSPGQQAPRAVPQVMTAAAQPLFDEQRSGRLELAKWLISPEHPLTARVMANRIWGWHFGQPLVRSPENFGLLGEKPSHPELLDWLADRFRNSGWSFKELHRVIMLSSAYQMSSAVEPASAQAASQLDPENRLISKFLVRRLEAEEIRDSLGSVAGSLDLSMGGKTIPLKNREFVFDHTSKDATTYDSRRRALYLPIIRNHLYDLFEQFDYPDPTVPTGSRHSTVVAPQALLMMNSDLVQGAAARLAAHLLSQGNWSDAQRIEFAYLKAYARTPTAEETARAQRFLTQFELQGSGANLQPAQRSAAQDYGAQSWGALCQAILSANEFIYLN